MEALEPILQRYSEVCSQLAFLGSQTIPTPVVDGLNQLHQNSGIPVDQIKFLLLVVAAYPIAFIYRWVPGATLKHIYSILLGIWMINFLVSYQWIHTFICSLLAYLILWISGPKYGKFIVWVFAMGYLSSLHIYRQWTDYLGWSFDVTTQMMIVVQKLTALGFNFYDGKANPKPTPSQELLGITELPGYIDPFHQLICDFVNSACAPAPACACCPRAYYSVPPCVVSSIYVPAARLKDPVFLSQPVWYVFGYVILCGCSTHFKYYFGFKIAEGSAIMSGWGYNRDESTKTCIRWDGAQGIDPKEFFFAQSFRTATNSWNMQTNKWLRRYAYERMSAATNMYGTYVISAFWHGFYPGYYIFFLTVAPVSMLARWVRATIRPRFLEPPALKMFYDFLSWIATNFTLTTFAMSFLLLEFEATKNLYASMYYFVHIICASAFLFSMTGILKPPRSPAATPKPATTPVQKKDN